MDLGVLEEMDGIRNKVQVKLQRQQVCSLSLFVLILIFSADVVLFESYPRTWAHVSGK
jgi:hypothetical protein